MELRQLRYFVGVAQALSFTKASRTLRVAQPALSRQIRQLEVEVGVQLLERNQRQVRLTPAGQAFFEEAQALLARSQQAVHAARLAGQPGAVPLRLGYVWGLFHSLLPPLLDRFRRQYPSVPVHLSDLSATLQAEAMRQGELDAGLIGFALEADEAKLSKRKISDCIFVAVLPRGHRLARSSKIPLEALAEEPFLAISEQSYPGAWRCVLEACRKAGFRPKVRQSAERGYAIVSLVAGHCGVALLPEPLRALPHPGVVFRQLKDPPESDLYIAWPPGRQTTSVDAFLELLPRLIGTERTKRA